MSEQTMGAERLELAGRAYRHCLLCEHRCGVDRARGERGFCRAAAEARVYRQRVECGEEVELIPSNLLYLSGCNLRCVFCIGEQDAFDPEQGRPLDSLFLNEMIAKGRQLGARNLQWVGGEPTIHLPAILEAMAGCSDLPPVVWKSNFFGTIESFALLDGVVDVYVADLKFGNDACARRIAGADNYMQTVARNLLWAADRVNRRGQSHFRPAAARRGAQIGTVPRLIVRHLLLPGHFECCFRPIVDWMCRCLPATPLRVMAGYLPRWHAGCCEELASPLDRGYGPRAAALAADKGLNVIV